MGKGIIDTPTNKMASDVKNLKNTKMGRVYEKGRWAVFYMILGGEVFG